MNLRPSVPVLKPPPFDSAEEEDFVFSKIPILETENVPSDIGSGDETDEEDHETRILSSWHHRAMLGDENRLLYTDFQDTDWEALQQEEEEREDETMALENDILL